MEKALQSAVPRLSGLNSRVFAAVAVAFAGWPVLRWYVLRLQDGSDEPFGLLALAAAVVFLPRTGWSETLSLRRWAVAASLLAGYVATYFGMPPLGHAVLWLGALTALVAPRAYALAWSALVVLALPFVATVQFYLGYPMRCVTTQLASWFLRAMGIAAVGNGTVLEWSGERVLIDVPCAGIQMLWTLLLATAVLAAARQLTASPTLRLFRWAAAAVFACNTVRAVVLFLIEMRFIPTPPFGHEGVGLVLFAAAAAILLWRVNVESRCDAERSLSRAGEGGARRSRLAAWTSFADSAATRNAARQGRLALPFTAFVCFCVASLGAASVPWIHNNESAQAATSDERSRAFPGWAAAPIPKGLRGIALGAREERFARDFPGQLAAFTDGTATWVVRWVEQPTRKLHPAADCLRGSGFAVTPGAASADRDGALWAGCSASRDGKTLRVAERIFGRGEKGWTDVSAWYWHAVFSRDSGPWWAVTKLEPAG